MLAPPIGRRRDVVGEHDAQASDLVRTDGLPTHDRPPRGRILAGGAGAAGGPRIALRAAGEGLAFCRGSSHPGCSCLEEQPADLRVQQAPEDAPAPGAVASPAPAGATPAGAVAGLLVEDEESPGPGQMTRTQFMDRLTSELTPMCDAELAVAGRTAQGCPILQFWLAFYRTRSASHVERAVQQYARPGTISDAGSLIAAVVGRVRAAVRIWVTTGQIAVPKGIDPAAGPTGGLVAGLTTGLATGVAAVGGAVAGLLRKPDPAASDAPPAAPMSPVAVRDRLGSGSPLPGAVRSRMEQGFGRSFADVRVHTDGEASGLARGFGARAFTVGSHIAFRDGGYRPGSVVGDLLLAHELAHTVQQDGGSEGGDLASTHSGLGEGSLDDEADRAAVEVVSGGQGSTAGRTGLRLQGCQEVKYRCPSGYSWRVQSMVGWGSGGCSCKWKCLPGAPPRPSTQMAYTCPADMNCSTGVRYEDLGEDYEKTGYGANFTPLGEQPMCGCFPLTLNGETISEAPLGPSDFEMTDVLGPAADIAAHHATVSPRTGVIEPSKTEEHAPRKDPMTPPPEHVAPPPKPPPEVESILKGEGLKGRTTTTTPPEDVHPPAGTGTGTTTQEEGTPTPPKGTPRVTPPGETPTPPMGTPVPGRGAAPPPAGTETGGLLGTMTTLKYPERSSVTNQTPRGKMVTSETDYAIRATWPDDPKAVAMFQRTSDGAYIEYVNGGTQGNGGLRLADALKSSGIDHPTVITTSKIINPPTLESLTSGTPIKDTLLGKMFKNTASGLGGTIGTIETVTNERGETSIRATIVY